MRAALFLLAALLLAGCQTYRARPLPVAAPLTADVGGALGVDDVVRLALTRSPDLVAQRAKLGVAQAQLVQSGVLPNPQLAGGFLPLIAGVGVGPAWNGAVTMDLKALILRAAKRRAAKDAVGQAEADLLWQEWQTAGQARQLATDLSLDRAQLAVADRLYAILQARNAASQAALANRDITLITAAPTAAALQTSRTARDGLAQKVLQLAHQLNALLGLHADARLEIAAPPAPLPLDPGAVRAGLATLADRRPDLIALRLGYASQEEAVRQAILSQFPDLILGPSITNDSSNVRNLGPQGTIGVPIFDRGQGTIAIARATREQLRAEYGARLATVTGEVEAALADIAQLQRQLAVAQQSLPQAKLAADRAITARGRSAIDEVAYIDLINTYFTREIELMQLRQALSDRQIALQTLLGAGLPQVDGALLAGLGGAG